MAGVLAVCGMAFEARIAAAAGAEVLYGARGPALERRLAERLRLPCDGVISFGVAGGLAPALPPGAVVVATEIIDGARSLASYPTDTQWTAALRAALPKACGGALAGEDGAVASVADKQAWWQATGALAVDMESHIAARQAQAARVPFVACRVVLDAAACAVPAAALAALGADGRTDLGALLLALARQPRQLPDLLKLARDAATARATLRAARRSVGPRFALPAAPYLAPIQSGTGTGTGAAGGAGSVSS